MGVMRFSCGVFVSVYCVDVSCLVFIWCCGDLLMGLVVASGVGCCACARAGARARARAREIGSESESESES
jgi:hypothetical protein